MLPSQRPYGFCSCWQPRFGHVVIVVSCESSAGQLSCEAHLYANMHETLTFSQNTAQNTTRTICGMCVRSSRINEKYRSQLSAAFHDKSIAPGPAHCLLRLGDGSVTAKQRRRRHVFNEATGWVTTVVGPRNMKSFRSNEGGESCIAHCTTNEYRLQFEIIMFDMKLTRHSCKRRHRTRQLTTLECIRAVTAYACPNARGPG